MGIVRITEEDVKKNVRNYRIKQTFFVLGVMAVSVIIIVSLIVYYNIKKNIIQVFLTKKLLICANNFANNIKFVFRVQAYIWNSLIFRS